MATMEHPSLEEVSNDFLQRQIRTTEEGTVTVEVEDARVYPFDEEWCLRIDSGEPFPNHFFRFPLGETRPDAFETILDFYPTPFESLDQLTFNTIEVDFDASHPVNGPPEAVEELEVSVRINGVDGFLCEVPRIHEYHFDKRDDSDEIQQKIEDEVVFYREIPKKIDAREDVQIKRVEPFKENVIILHLDGFDDGRTLPVALKLPSIDSVTDHPVAEFIQSVGSGKIENLENEFVYICEQSDTDSIVGLDVRFEKYGVAPTPPESDESDGFLSRLF